MSQCLTFLKVGAGDEIYKYDRQQQQSLLAAKPWEKDPHFFKVLLLISCCQSRLHLPFAGHQDFCTGSAEDGDACKVRGKFGDHGAVAWKGWWKVEIMYHSILLQVDANVMVVMDSFALPVEGTETRVNAQAQGYEYMTAYIESAKQVGINLNHESC